MEPVTLNMYLKIEIISNHVAFRIAQDGQDHPTRITW